MNMPKRVWIPVASAVGLVIAQVVLVAATFPTEEPAQQPPTCPGATMAVQATGVYVNRPVPEWVVNGEPWGGAFWEPGMRSYWHCHTAGQLLVVWEGEGRTQKRGQRMQTLHKGESSWAGPGEEHWHGGGTTTAGQFLQGSPTPSQTLWMEEVADADYLGNGLGLETRAEFLRTGVRERPR
jgi:hypothetical protein